tara:strand:+ start:80 stop:745 length:666 start_codon:yes stop_codon:yes gene_type:complete
MLPTKIYILHHTPLKERKGYLKRALEKQGIVVEWVEGFKPEEIKEKYEEYLKGHEIFYDTTIHHPYGKYKNFSKKININELSLYLKYKYCFEQQSEHNYETILILEDDVIIPSNINEYLNNNTLEFLNTDGDILVMGESHHFRVQNKNGKYIHHHPKNKTRCAHAILYKLKCNSKILNTINIINLPIDFKLNEIMQKENLKVYWSDPGLKQNKNYKTSVQI